MIKEKRTYKDIKTGELIYVEFVIGDYVVYSKDWKVYKMPTNEFTTQYTEFEYKCYVHVTDQDDKGKLIIKLRR